MRPTGYLLSVPFALLCGMMLHENVESISQQEQIRQFLRKKALADVEIEAQRVEAARKSGGDASLGPAQDIFDRKLELRLDMFDEPAAPKAGNGAPSTKST